MSPNNRKLVTVVVSLGNTNHICTCVYFCILSQARPEDYAKEFLAHQTPISFHKHWNIDPIVVFNKWLKNGEHTEGLQKSTKEEL